MKFVYIGKVDSTKNDLIFCPVCGWRLDDHQTNETVRTCVNHPDIFVLEEIEPDEFVVHVNLSGREWTPPDQT